MTSRMIGCSRSPRNQSRDADFQSINTVRRERHDHARDRGASTVLAFCWVMLFSMLGCNRGDAMTTSASTEAPAVSRLTDVSAAEWQRLKTRRIFFGHQSVGGNLLDGVRQVIASNPQIGLRVVEADRLSDVPGPALVHRAIGRNYDPASKNAAFMAVLDSTTSALDVALYKFCYVDIGADTDPDVLFASYVHTIDEVQMRHPTVAIVHVTLPLMSATPPGRAKALVRRALGRPPISEVEYNVKRNRYNTLLRARYAGRAPVFDLARIESTRSDGSRSYFVRGSDTVYTLAPEWTTDGGHLNATAQRLAAEQFLIVLARL